MSECIGQCPIFKLSVNIAAVYNLIRSLLCGGAVQLSYSALLSGFCCQYLNMMVIICSALLCCLLYLEQLCRALVVVLALSTAY